MDKVEIEKVFNSWSKVELKEGKSFDDLFKVGSVSLWWIYKRFIEMDMLARFGKYSEILDKIDKKEKVKNNSKAVFLMRKLLDISEKTKIRLGRKKETSTEKMGVLFVTYANHLQKDDKVYRLQNVINKVEEAGLRSLVVVADPISKRSIKKLKSSSNTIYGYVDYKAKTEAKEKAIELSEEWKGLKTEIKHSMVLSNGFSLYSFFKNHLEFLFSKEFIYYNILYYEAMKNAIRENNVRVVLTTASIGIFEKAAMVAANDMNVACILAQHGIGTGFSKTDMRDFKKLNFAVFGEIDKDKLINKGIEGDKINVTGSISFDDIVKYKSETRNNEVKNVLFLTQPFVEVKMWDEVKRNNFFNVISHVAENFENVRIKLHPMEDIEVYKKRFDKYKNIEISQDNLYEEIKNSDIVLGVFSTSLSESIILDKPVVIVDLFGQTEDKEFINKDIMLKIKTPENMKKYIEEYFNVYYSNQELREKREEYIRRFFYKADGNASERVVDIINKVI